MYDAAERVLNEIERLRARLHELVGHAALSDPEVLRLSRKMDSLVVEYHRIIGSGRTEAASGH
jgi:hypothetical protein